MLRRDFIKTVGGGLPILPALGGRVWAAGLGQGGPEEEEEEALGQWFMAHREELRKVREFIRAETKTLVDLAFQTPPGKGPRLPYPYIPVHKSPEWGYLFYWDTYFIIRELLKDGWVEVARNQVRNFLFEIERFGYVMNANVYAWGTRSQPPLITLMVRAISEAAFDPAFLQECYPALKQDYEKFWLGPLHRMPGSSFSRYQDNGFGLARLLRYPQNVLSNAQAECESGWDYSPRFEKRCLDFLPVDLNAYLYRYELDLAWMAERTGLSAGEVALWQERAKTRKAGFNEIFWDPERRFYFDYDFKNRRRGPVWSLAGYLPVWAGLAGEEQVQGAAAALGRFQKARGLAVCDQDYGIKDRQWNFPNSWPPLTWWTKECLRENGFQREAGRVIRQYLSVQTRLFRQTGELWEKYNAVSGDLDVTGGHEFGSNPMQGWSAAVFSDFYELAGKAAGE